MEATVQPPSTSPVLGETNYTAAELLTKSLRIFRGLGSPLPTGVVEQPHCTTCTASTSPPHHSSTSESPRVGSRFSFADM